MDLYNIISISLSFISIIVMLYLNGKIIKENTKTRQIQLLNDIFKRMHDIVLKYHEKADEFDEEKKNNFAIEFLNIIEYLSFLVNRGYIDLELFSFFKPTFKKYYEEIITQIFYQYPEMKDRFRETKKLYKKIKNLI